MGTQAGNDHQGLCMHVPPQLRHTHTAQSLVGSSCPTPPTSEERLRKQGWALRRGLEEGTRGPEHRAARLHGHSVGSTSALGA